ncbi:hypothetical protein CS0771_57420 [Catellatospora sp. IY07-71]|nr:hypothetical protein CS0771_57420 [Catellatospora sp. IY07-71]
MGSMILQSALSSTDLPAVSGDHSGLPYELIRRALGSGWSAATFHQAKVRLTRSEDNGQHDARGASPSGVVAAGYTDEAGSGVGEFLLQVGADVAGGDERRGVALHIAEPQRAADTGVKANGGTSLAGSTVTLSASAGTAG